MAPVRWRLINACGRQCDERDAGGRHHGRQARRGRDPDRPEGRVVADPAGDTPTKAEYVALRDALVTAGLMRPKSVTTVDGDITPVLTRIG